MVESPGCLAGLLAAIRDLSIGIAGNLITNPAKRVLATLWRAVKKMPPWLVLVIVLFMCQGAAFAFDVVTRPPLPKRTPPASPTVPPTPIPSPTPYPPCLYKPGEWPCADVVRDKTPRDNLYEIAVRNYGARGEAIDKFASLICAANWIFLYKQFVNSVSPDHMGDWGNDPCQFLLPGDVLIIPYPPKELLQLLTPTPPP